MDILLTDSGDLYLDGEGDIAIEDSLAQKIRIKILWFAGEWRFDEDRGLPYYENLFIKNPNIEVFEDALRESLFEIEEIEDVLYVDVDIDIQTRTAIIEYAVETSEGEIEEEVEIHERLWSD